MKFSKSVSKFEKQAKKFLRETKDIEGWITFEDASMISSLLSWQRENMYLGNVLEIGAYKGKTAALLARNMPPQSCAMEKLYLVDLFTMDIGFSENSQEVEASYGKRDIKSLTDSLNKANESVEVVLIDCNSEILHEKLSNIQFSFIHIDGSHLFHIVLKDLEYAISHLNDAFGIIAVDDFRSIHTPGVARAVWKVVEKFDLRILLVGPGKAYLTSSKFVSTAKEIFQMMNYPIAQLKYAWESDRSIPYVASPCEYAYSIGMKRNLFRLINKL